MNTIVRTARAEDIGTVMAIAEARKYNRSAVVDQSSFVTNCFTREELQGYLDRREIVVAEAFGDVAAYAIFSDTATMDSENKHIDAIRAHTDDGEFVFIVQVATADGKENKGYGLALYDRIIALRGEKPIYVNSLVSPPNQDALHFHKIAGFDFAFDSDRFEDGRHRIYFRKISNNNYPNEALLKQFEKACDLYVHEEDLNWRKVSTMFYVNVGLVALMSVIIQTDGFWSLPVLGSMVIVSALGGLLTWAFAASLTSGVGQVRRRKHSIMRIDQALQPKTGQLAVIDKTFAPTLTLLEWTPRVLIGLWTVLVVVSTTFTGVELYSMAMVWFG